MPMNHHRRRYPILRSLLPAVFAMATLPAATLFAEEPRMYRVELVLFSQTDPEAIRSEVWRSGEPARLEEALDLAEPGEEETDRPVRDAAGTPFGLRGVVTRLEQSPLYEVIASYAWEQPGLPQEQSIPIRIRAGQLLGHALPFEEPPSFAPWQIRPVLGGVPPQPEEQEPLYEVDGTITLTLARFLHLQTDLLYRRATNEELPGDHVRTREGRLFAESHVNERRRMRSGETHYLDHPMMGVIVQVIPLEQ